MEKLLQSLDENQRAAVLHTKGPLLVLAGAGSGKTRVLTFRIARLVKEKHCRPSEILALTFTNKAAKEMKERIAGLTSKRAASVMTVSTFHSFGVKILREFGQKIGISQKFTILDDNDRLSILKTIMRNSSKTIAKEDVNDYSTSISLAKNASLVPDEYSKENPEERKIARVYQGYHEILKKRQVVDFDDLLLLPLLLFKKHPDILEIYRKRYKFFSIDEFQDTNTVQMKLAKLLAAPNNNIMVVGDDDQGIYSWRGADIENIIYFNHSFKDCKTIILDRNYRSTPEIVGGAHGVIQKNSKRKLKDVKAMGKGGTPIMTYKAEDELEECEYVVETIIEHEKNKQFSYGDHAILFRTNALMRRFEEELRARRVPYQVQGSMSFFDRKEVKDVFAYLRFFANHHDELSLTRMLKVPNRGITAGTLERLEDLASLRKISLWDAFERHQFARGIQDVQHDTIGELVAFVHKYDRRFRKGDLSQALRDLLQESGYVDLIRHAYKDDKSLEIRLENIEEVIHGVEIFEARNSDDILTLDEYLQQSMLTFGDNPNDKNDGKKVILMTMHKSKGLEFPVVFVPTLDNAIFPSPRSIAEGNIEEERRLFYVAMTRAERRLILTCPASKIFRKKPTPVQVCRFVYEIPVEYLDNEFGAKQDSENSEMMDDFFAQMREKFKANNEAKKG